MKLTLTPMPSSVRAKDILPNTDPVTGVVTATTRPTQKSWAVGQGILGAMGVRLDLYGAGRDHHENLELLTTWLTAYDVRMLVMRHATIVSNHAVLDDLLDVCLATGTDLALTCDDTVGERLADWVTRRSGEIEQHHDELLSRIRRVSRPGPARTPGGEEVGEVDLVPRTLPRVDFYKFRARCRDTLTPEQFAAVDAYYEAAFREVRAQPFTSIEQASDRLRQMTEDSDNPGVALTRLRASQAAMFTLGLYLTVHVPYYLSVIRDNEHRRLTAPEVYALRALRNPWRSASIVLHDAKVDSDTVARLKIDNITPDGVLTSVKHEPMLPQAALYLRAQRILRLTQGAAPTDPFITQHLRSLASARRRAAIDLNLPRTPTRRVGTDEFYRRWQLHLGCSMNSLTALRLPEPAVIESWGRDR